MQPGSDGPALSAEDRGVGVAAVGGRGVRVHAAQSVPRRRVGQNSSPSPQPGVGASALLPSADVVSASTQLSLYPAGESDSPSPQPQRPTGLLRSSAPRASRNDLQSRGPRGAVVYQSAPLSPIQETVRVLKSAGPRHGKLRSKARPARSLYPHLGSRVVPPQTAERRPRVHPPPP